MHFKETIKCKSVTSNTKINIDYRIKIINQQLINNVYYI